MTSRSYAYLVASGALERLPADRASASASMAADPVSMVLRMDRDAMFEKKLDAMGRVWNSLLHPRDRFGRFIRTFSRISWDPLSGWGSATERRRDTRAGGLFEADILAFDSGGETMVAKVTSAQPGAVLGNQPIEAGDLIRVNREDVHVKTIKAKIGLRLKQGRPTNKQIETANEAARALQDLGHQDLAQRMERARDSLLRKNPNVGAAIDEARAVGKELQDRTDRELASEGVGLETVAGDIKDPVLRARARRSENAMANLNTFKHRLGDRTYENRFTRDRPMSGADTDRRTQVAQMELENAAREGAQVIDLTKGPGAVTTSPAVYQGDATGSKGVLRREGADVLPELVRGMRQAVGQGYRRLAGIGQAWQGSSPGDRLVVNSDGLELGVGFIVHYPGGQGRGGGSKEAYTAAVVRIETKKDRPEGESGFENVRAHLQRLDPETGEIIKSEVKGEVLQIPDADQFNRFVQLAKSEAALSLLADRPEKGKRSKEKYTELKDALEHAERTGTIFAEPGAKRRSGAGREDRRLPSASGELIRRGDYVRTPEGAIGRVTYIEEPDEDGRGGRAYIELPHAQTYARLAGSKLERLHDANNDVMIDAYFHNGGVFMPTREEAAQALDRLGVGGGPARAAVMDPSSTGADIKRAMRSDQEFMAAVGRDMVPVLERRNAAMATGTDPAAEDQRAMQDWDAVISASGGYFRDPADPLPEPGPESLQPPSPSPGDPADPQDPSNPTKAITPDGTRVDGATGAAEPEQKAETGIRDTVGWKIGAGLDRARLETEALLRRRGSPVADEGLFPTEFAALRQAVEDRDPEAFYSALERMERRIRSSGSTARWANTPLRAVLIDGRNSGGQPLAPYLREKYGDDLFAAPEAPAPTPTPTPEPGATESRPTSEADSERPPDIDKAVDELNNSLSEKLISEGSARVLDGDGNVLTEGFAVIRPGPDSRASFDEAPTAGEIEGFVAGNAIEGDTALAAWQSDDGSWNLGVVDLAPDKETAHDIATDADGSGQYIDIVDGMVYNAVPTDSATDDVVDDRSRERGTRPSPDGGSAELVGATDRQKEIIGQVAESGSVPDRVRDTLQRMASGTGTFTAEEMREAVDWLKKVGPSEIWDPEQYTARQRNGLKAAVLNLAKRLSEDSGASGPDPYPSKATSERRSREVAQLLSESFARLEMDDAARQDLVAAIADARAMTRSGRYTDAADIFRGLATAYETASGQDGYNPRVAPRARLHADRLEGAQKSVPARRTAPSAAQLQRLSFISRIEPHLGSTAEAREIRALFERARRESLEGAPTASRTIRDLEQRLRDNPGVYRAGVEGAASSRWSDLAADGSIGAPSDAKDLEELGSWQRNARDFVDTYADAGDDGVVGRARSMLDDYADEENRILEEERGGPDEYEASAREADDAARAAADAITPESLADRSDEELDALAERLLEESEEASHTPETDEALDRAASAVAAERASRTAPSVLTDEQRDAVERASGDLSGLDDVELESLRDEARAVRSALPDDIDEETADRVDGAVDRVDDEIADRLEREVYDDEEPAPAPEIETGAGEATKQSWYHPEVVRIVKGGSNDQDIDFQVTEDGTIAYRIRKDPDQRFRYTVQRPDGSYIGEFRVYDSAVAAFRKEYEELWDGLPDGEPVPGRTNGISNSAPAESPDGPGQADVQHGWRLQPVDFRDRVLVTTPHPDAKQYETYATYDEVVERIRELNGAERAWTVASAGGHYRRDKMHQIAITPVRFGKPDRDERTRFVDHGDVPSDEMIEEGRGRDDRLGTVRPTEPEPETPEEAAPDGDLFGGWTPDPALEQNFGDEWRSLPDEKKDAIRRDIADEGVEDIREYARNIGTGDGQLSRYADALLAEPGDRVLPEEQRDEIDSNEAETPEPEPQDLEESLPARMDDAPAPDDADTVYAELDEVIEAITRLDDEDFEPTLQQKRIIAAIQSGKNVVVRAMAGTGKTSTLLAAAKRELLRDPDKRILYIAFNKSVQVEANAKFPPNTEVRTANSLAWAAMGTKFTDKTKSKRGKGRDEEWMTSKPESVARYIGLNRAVWNESGGRDGNGAALNTRGAVMLMNEAVTRFMISADADLTEDHVRAAERVRGVDLKDDDRAYVLEKARAVWKDYQDPDGRLKMSQDALVKMWVMSEPDLRSATRSDGRGSTGVKRGLGGNGIIFFDEAQDINPVLAQVVNGQQAQLITVGDGNQSIYGFRGATNQLDKMKADYDLPLSESWRFGPGVAEAGNRMLRLGGSKDRVVGSGPDSEILQPNTMKDPGGFLTRTNAGALAAALEMMGNGRVTGVSEKQRAKFEAIHASIQWLIDNDNGRAGPRPGNFYEDLESFDSWNEVIEEATTKEGPQDPVARLVYNIYSSVEDWDKFLDKLRVMRDNADLRHETVTLDRVATAAAQAEVLIDGVKIQEVAPRVRGKKTYAIFGNTYNNVVSIKQAIDGHGRKWNGSAPQPTGNRKGYWSFDARSPEEAAEIMNRIQDYIAGKDIETMVVTGHMAKGLEWDSVRIADDFRDFVDKDGNPVLPDPEELRLFYVMLTRAKKRLDPGGLGELLDWDPEELGIPKTDDPFPIEYVGDPARDVVPGGGGGEGPDPWLEGLDLSAPLGSPSRGSGPVGPDPFQPGAPEGDSDQEGDPPDAGDVVPAAPAGFSLTAVGEPSPWF